MTLNESGLSKESAFVSAVVYTDRPVDASFEALAELDNELYDRFLNYEIVCIVDANDDGQLHDYLCGLVSKFRGPVTIVDMGKKQGLETAMNAGIDMAVGDYVLEVDDLASFDSGFLARSFALSQEKGFDIVSGVASHSSVKGIFFYPVFNRFSGTTGKLETGSARLVSRRALNRVHSMSTFMPYRKAAYAASGLRMTSVPLDESRDVSRHSGIGLAIDSLALYTDFFYKASAFISIAMVVVSILEMAYVLAVLINGHAVEGWVTSMLVVTFGFLGIFVLLTFLMKYVALLVRFQFHNMNYLVERVEKVERS